jgi:hypothetical protein
MTKDIAQLFLSGRITEQEAMELVASRKKLDKDIDKPCVKQGIAITTMRHEYQGIRRRAPTKYRA